VSEHIHPQTAQPVGEPVNGPPGQRPGPVTLNGRFGRLEKLDRTKASVVEMRFFSGLTIDETAEALGTSPSTVKRDWTLARAFLYRELTRTGA